VRHPHQVFSLIELMAVVALIALPSQMDRIVKEPVLEGIKL
jgi:Tfp pilus assembly protein FimT